MTINVEFTTNATALLLRMQAEYPDLVLLLDSMSCCANSNVMVRENLPNWPVDLLLSNDGLRVCMNPLLRKSLRAARVVIDMLEFADDSLSLETNYGKRFFMSTAQ